MRRYDISIYLHDKQKSAILAHKYIPLGGAIGIDADGLPIRNKGLSPVSADDGESCPLHYLPGVNSPTPSAEYAGSVIARLYEWTGCGHGDPDCSCYVEFLDAVGKATYEFVEDWDDGKIPPEQLAEALNYEAQP